MVFMTANEIGKTELTFVPGNTQPEKDFRAIYPRVRLPVVADKEPVLKTVLRAIHESRLVPKINPRLFRKEFVELIKPKLPLNYTLENQDALQNDWTHLPNGETILLIRPVDYVEKDFMGWG